MQLSSQLPFRLNPHCRFGIFAWNISCCNCRRNCLSNLTHSCHCGSNASNIACCNLRPSNLMAGLAAEMACRFPSADLPAGAARLHHNPKHSKASILICRSGLNAWTIGCCYCRRNFLSDLIHNCGSLSPMKLSSQLPPQPPRSQARPCRRHTSRVRLEKGWPR